MPLSQILIAHAAATTIVSLLVIAGVLIDASPTYHSVAMLGILPVVFLVVYITSIVPVVLARRWAIKNGVDTYWQAALAGGGLGAVLYFCFAWLINGREIAAEPVLALTVLASGLGLGAAGGLTFLVTERRLKNSKEFSQ